MRSSAPISVGRVRSLNVAAKGRVDTRQDISNGQQTGIYKEPVDGPAWVEVPGPKEPGPGKSGVAGDYIGDGRHHGGPDQAVYAYAREDLDWWEAELGGRGLPDGMFGENLTTEGLDLAGAIVGERWAIGDGGLVLEAASPRIPCSTFAAKLGVERWVKRFTERGVTGVYLRVVVPGAVRRGDRVNVLDRPEHGVTISAYFRAITTERERLRELVPAREFLHEETREKLVRVGL